MCLSQFRRWMVLHQVMEWCSTIKFSVTHRWYKISIWCLMATRWVLMAMRTTILYRSKATLWCNPDKIKAWLKVTERATKMSPVKSWETFRSQKNKYRTGSRVLFKPTNLWKETQREIYQLNGWQSPWLTEWVIQSPWRLSQSLHCETEVKYYRERSSYQLRKA